MGSGSLSALTIEAKVASRSGRKQGEQWKHKP